MSKTIIEQVDKQLLEQSVKQSHSFYQVLKDIGYKQIYDKRTIEKVKIKCNEFAVDYSHLREDRQLETIICNECGKEKSFSEFYMYNGKLLHTCLECKKKKQNKNYNKNITELNEYKSKCHCQKCLENRFYLLDFHHKNSNEKSFGISKKANVKLSTLMPEIEKCVVLCSNCHREFHYLQHLNNNFTLEEYLDG